MRRSAFLLALALATPAAAHAAIVDLTLDAPGHSALAALDPTDDHRGFVAGTLNSLDPFTLSVTVDEAGVYRISSLRPADILPGETRPGGLGGFVNASPEAWGTFSLEIIDNPPGDPRFTLAIIASDAGPGRGRGLGNVRFGPDARSFVLVGNFARPDEVVDPGQVAAFAFDVRLAAGTTVFRYAPGSAAFLVPEPGSLGLVLLGLGGAMAAMRRGSRASS